MREITSHLKNLKPEVAYLNQDGGDGHLEFSKKCHNLGKYWPILVKFETWTQKNISHWTGAKPEALDKIDDGHYYTANWLTGVVKTYFWYPELFKARYKNRKY